MNNIQEIENFLNYMQDKVSDCYKQETQNAVNQFINELKERK